MSTKADFSADQWDVLRTSPMMAAVLVMTASPSGPVGLVQESSAVGRMILQAADSAQTPLLKSLAEDMKTAIPMAKIPKGASPNNVQDAATEILRRTSGLLEEKATPEEASEVRQWLTKVAQVTAEAAKEGGFLGMGGTQVSDQEKAAIARVESTLGSAAA